MILEKPMTADEVLAATDVMWDLSGPFPMPRDDIRCPVCRCDALMIRNWKYHVRPPHATLRWRCDVNLKCCACAAIWTHGVAVSQAYFDKAMRRGIVGHRIDRHGRKFR